MQVVLLHRYFPIMGMPDYAPKLVGSNSNHYFNRERQQANFMAVPKK